MDIYIYKILAYLVYFSNIPLKYQNKISFLKSCVKKGKYTTSGVLKVRRLFLKIISTDFDQILKNCERFIIQNNAM